MRSLWWNLPGPKAFVDNAVAKLERGASVVLALPGTGPTGMSEQVRRRWRQDDWRVIDAALLRGAFPAELLIRRFCPQQPPSGPVSASAFLEQTRGRGLLIGLQLEDVGSWDDWKWFLEELAELARHLEPHERPLFLVEVVGSPAVTPAREGVAISSMSWRGVVQGEDMALYAAFLVRDQEAPVHIRRMKGSVVSELAIWDSALADRLAQAPLTELLNPIPLLKEVGVERGWTIDGNVSAEDPVNWAAGKADRTSGGYRLHSSVIANSCGEDEIRRRVWAGQVAVLFPLIERLRLKALSQLKIGLKPPIRVRDDTVDDLALLEVGQLSWLLRNHQVKRADPVVESAIHVMTRMRNALAHLEVVDEATAEHPDLNRLMAI